MADDSVRVRLLRLAPAVVLVLGAMVASKFEPVGPQQCEDAEIAGVSVVRGRTLDQKYYNVASAPDFSKPYTIPFDGTFSENYVGPAAVWITVGKWTGTRHYALTGRCADRPVQ
jgi:hypothetical protein